MYFDNALKAQLCNINNMIADVYSGINRKSDWKGILPWFMMHMI